MRRVLGVIAVALLFVAVVNYMTYWIAAVFIGGDATNGKIENGKYYLSSGGELREVSPRVWHYSRVHAKSLWITHPLGILGVAAFAWWEKRKA